MNASRNIKKREAMSSVEFSKLDITKRLKFLHHQWGENLVASTSFGIQSSIMLHLISRHIPKTPVIFIDTGYLFPETYHYAEELSNRLNINLRIYTSKYSASRIEALWGPVWEQGEVGENRYSYLTKIEPMNRALSELNAQAWISGVRRSQSKTRVNKKFVEKQNQIEKAYPILDWSDEQVSQYIIDNDLPAHPLQKKGYVTSGDVHSTKPLQDVANAEETRFGGQKYECGLHRPTNDPSLVL